MLMTWVVFPVFVCSTCVPGWNCDCKIIGPLFDPACSTVTGGRLLWSDWVGFWVARWAWATCWSWVGWAMAWTICCPLGCWTYFVISCWDWFGLGAGLDLGLVWFEILAQNFWDSWWCSGTCIMWYCCCCCCGCRNWSWSKRICCPCGSRGGSSTSNHQECRDQVMRCHPWVAKERLSSV